MYQLLDEIDGYMEEYNRLRESEDTSKYIEQKLLAIEKHLRIAAENIKELRKESNTIQRITSKM